MANWKVPIPPQDEKYGRFTEWITQFYLSIKKATPPGPGEYFMSATNTVIAAGTTTNFSATHYFPMKDPAGGTQVFYVPVRTSTW